MKSTLRKSLQTLDCGKEHCGTPLANALPDERISIRRRISGYLLAVLAVLTCPCHIPIFAALLAGIAAGGFLTEHFGTAILVFLVLFLISVAGAMYSFNGRNLSE